MADKINTNFKVDYEDFLCDYILPLLGIEVAPERKNLDRTEVYLGEKCPAIEQMEGKLNFNVSGWRILSIPCVMKIPEDDISLVLRILQSYPDISQYKRT